MKLFEIKTTANITLSEVKQTSHKISAKLQVVILIKQCHINMVQCGITKDKTGYLLDNN
jgi:hypothetical protein